MNGTLGLVLRGLFLGFSIAAPVGPVGLLCIRRTLSRGTAHGLISGLGAATADAFYGCIAGFGLTFVSDLLVGGQVWLRLVGGLFLCYLGVRAFLAGVARDAAPAEERGLAGAYTSTLFLTLTNPITILSFAAILAGAGGGEVSWSKVAALVAGTFLGSALWWLTLSGLVGLLRHKFNPTALRWVNRLSGLAIAGFGLSMLLSLLWSR